MANEFTATGKAELGREMHIIVFIVLMIKLMKVLRRGTI